MRGGLGESLRAKRATERSPKGGKRVCRRSCFMLIAAVAVEILLRLKRVSGHGEALATTPVGLATRIAVKVCAYTYAFMVNRMLNRPQGRIKELWA